LTETGKEKGQEKNRGSVERAKVLEGKHREKMKSGHRIVGKYCFLKLGTKLCCKGNTES